MTANDSQRQLLIRADGGQFIGGGHVVRCLTLAAHFERTQVTFAIRDDQGVFVERIEAAGYEVIRLVEEPLPGPLLGGAWPVEMQQRDLDQIFAASSDDYSAVIVDHYGLDSHWEQGIRERTNHVFGIDDLANRRHSLDVLVDQNWYGPGTPSRYEDLVPPETLCLLGPRYALLQPDYVTSRKASQPANRPPQRILVSFGGSDPTGETAKVVEAISAAEFSDLTADVVLGSSHLLTDRLASAIEDRAKTSLHIGVPTLAGLLASADLAFGASGAGTWERMCLDVPAIVTTTSAAHSGVTEALANAGMTTWAGIGGQVSVDRYRRLLAEHMTERPSASPSVVDGLGAARVAEAFMPNRSASLSLRPAAPGDGPQFNGVDPGGPPDAPTQLDGPAVWLSEEQRFRNALTDPHQARLVVMSGSTPIGRVEAGIIGEELHLDFVLDDSVAGRGLGRQLASRLGPSAWQVSGDRLSYIGGGGTAPPPKDVHDRYGSLRMPTGSIAPSTSPRGSMSPKSALILGTLAGQVDAVALLKDQGWTVYTCGHRREGPGVTAADDFFLVDILDVDAMTDLAARLGVDVVYSVGSDIAMPTVTRVSQRLGLPGFHSVELTDVLQRKDLLRSALAQANLSPVQHAKLGTVSDLEGFSTYPAIVKPSDSQGQRGIAVVQTEEQAAEVVAAALSYSNSGTAIIEEWLDGPEISVHAFAVAGKVRFFLPSDRLIWKGELIGVASGHVMPAHTLDTATEPVVRALVDEFVTALGVDTGPLYFQMKLTSNGPRIIEVASRFDGCHLWRLIIQHTGFDLMGAAFNVLAGEAWEDPAPWAEDTTDSLHFHLGPPDRPFHIADYAIADTPTVTFQELQVDEGAMPRDANGVVSRMGYYMTTEAR